MNHFSEEDINIIVTEAKQGRIDKLVKTTTDLIERIVKKKLSLHKIPFNEFDVEDFRQSVLKKLWEKKCKLILIFDPKKSSFKSWVILITNNVVIDELKKKSEPLRISGYTQRINKMDEYISGIIDKKSVLKELEQIQRIDIIKHYIKTFSGLEQTIFKFKYFDELSIAIIARNMRKTESNISVILHRTKKQLIKNIQEDEDCLLA